MNKELVTAENSLFKTLELIEHDKDIGQKVFKILYA